MLQWNVWTDRHVSILWGRLARSREADPVNVTWLSYDAHARHRMAAGKIPKLWRIHRLLRGRYSFRLAFRPLKRKSSSK